VNEWNELIVTEFRGLRGGSYVQPDWDMGAWERDFNDPTLESSIVGFRVGLVPEPATLILLSMGAALIARRCKGG